MDITAFQNSRYLQDFWRFWLNILCLITLFILTAPSILYAEEDDTIFEQISTERRLPESRVFCIFQDQKGFMWFGTDGGLYKYDGYTFTVYTNDPANPISLSNDSVRAIYEDRTGTLWIGTEGGGLNQFDRTTEQFIHYKHTPNNPHSLSDNRVSAIYEDRFGVLWLGTREGGLNRFSRETEQFISYRTEPNDPHSLSNNWISVIYEDRLGELWIGTVGGGIQKFDRKTGYFIHYKFDPSSPYSLSNNSVWSIYEDSLGGLWIGTYNGLNKFDREIQQFRHYQHEPQNPQSLSNNDVRAIYEDRAGTLWIGTWFGGLNKLKREPEQFIHYRLSDNRVTAMYEDRSGVLWIGTMFGGLNKLERNKKRFIHYHTNPDTNSLNDNYVQAIYEDRSGALWIGTQFGGLNKLDPRSSRGDNERFIHYQQDPGNLQSLSSNDVRAIYEDRSETLWIGTEFGGLNRFDRDLEHFIHYQTDPDDPDSLSDNRVRSIFEDRTGILWIGTFGGLNRYDRKTGRFIRYLADPHNPSTLSDNRVQVIYQDGRGMLWIGTANGLNKYDRRTEEFTRYLADPYNPQSLSHNDVKSVLEDQSGVLWIGTANGLNKLDQVSETFTHYTEKDGLPHNTIFGILEDDVPPEQGGPYLWLSTGEGLSKFHSQIEQFKNYDVRDGLQSNMFNPGAYHKSRRGEMFFGGKNGFNAFYPAPDNPFPPSIVITDFLLFNKSVRQQEDAPLQKPITETEEVTLSYKDYMFSFEFAALHYSAPENNQYAYMMEGFDKDWNHIGTRRVATYTNLPAGKYIFRVKGANSDGLWNEKGTSITITITPPPWKTWWAYSLYVITVVGAIMGYVWHTTKTQAKELARQQKELEQERLVTERLRQVDKLKDEFLAKISHELRTPLNGIIGIAESLLDGVAGQPNEQMRQNFALIISSGKRLASLVNDILDFSKLKRQDLQLRRKPVDIRTLSDIVLKMSEPLVAGKDVTLNNVISKDIPPVFGDENRLQQILYNLVGNAVKYTDSGSITVSAKVTLPFPPSMGDSAGSPLKGGEEGVSPLLEGSQGSVEISVADTGIGIPQDKLEEIFKSFEQVDSSISRRYGGAGLGLSITKQLVELHGGTICVDSKPRKGTTFIFTLPISEGTPEMTKQTRELAQIRESGIQVPAFKQEKIPSNGEYRILSVDDEPINQQVLANHLAFENYVIVQALTGEEALNLIERKGKFDLVLLDIMMPRMSGYEVCQRIRKRYLPTELPVIMITAKDQVTDLLEGFSSGANDYLAKPFSKDELLARIKTQLNLLKINTAYGKFVPHEFLRLLQKESILDVKLGDQVQKEMTILFSDIREFTTLSEVMSPEETFKFINSYLSQMEPVIADHHGFIDKYIGDTIMALFSTDADGAVHNAIAMMKRLGEYNENRKRAGYRPIQIGIGLNTGRLILGTVGGQRRMEGTVISDAVNLASRLEGLTKRYDTPILISEHTFSRLTHPNQFYTRFLGKVQVKGKLEAVSIYEVYDGDPEDVIAFKVKTAYYFENGLNHYFAKEFADAAKCFKQVLAVHTQDKPAQLYLERSKYFLAQGVPDGWQGVEVMESK